MLKFTPTENLIFRTRAVRRSIATFLSCAIVLLCAVGHANAALQNAAESDWTSALFSPYVITIALVGVLIGLVYYRRVLGNREAEELAAMHARRRAKRDEMFYLAPAGSMPAEPTVLNERHAPASESAQSWEKPAEVETSVYGAYRIDQEVNKLVIGKPHRMEVMASRALDDRRAIEASLMKALDSPQVTEDERQRIRAALEEYGFVARQSATLLMGRDAWERSSAARVLGQIGAPSSLAFLIEALHDNDSVVRNQAITSLGSLKIPAAIGALLDIAQRHPDIPASLLAETLSACSVESLGFLDGPSSEPALLAGGNGSREPAGLERTMSFEDLPSGNDDNQLTEALNRLEAADDHGRTMVAQELALHPSQRSVYALTAMVVEDSDPAVRSAAVSSLGSIDHESVLAPVLIALSDESRIVRAAAARTLTSLHFDRAEAYVRIMETAEPEMLQRVSRACIKTGIVGQAVDRLASEDRRQAFEAFSLFSLLARANEIEPIIDAIENHRDDEVRLCAVRVLNVAGQPSLAPKLREVVGRVDIPENVRTAVLEVLYKLDQGPPVVDQPEPIFEHEPIYGLNPSASDMNLIPEERQLDLNPSDNETVTLHNPN
jgi:HEAT repeat protein